MLRGGKRSNYGKVSGICYGLKWIDANRKDSKHRWSDKFQRGHHLLRVVDVGMVKNLHLLSQMRWVDHL